MYYLPYFKLVVSYNFIYRKLINVLEHNQHKRLSEAERLKAELKPEDKAAQGFVSKFKPPPLSKYQIILPFTPRYTTGSSKYPTKKTANSKGQLEIANLEL